jgi:hypothetical protein
MSDALDWVRNNCGMAGEEVASMVDDLEDKFDAYSKAKYWQPIETAPKIDGERFLAMKDCGNGTLPSHSILFWLKDELYIDSTNRTVKSLGYRATHWMPLPSPPVE